MSGVMAGVRTGTERAFIQGWERGALGESNAFAALLGMELPAGARHPGQAAQPRRSRIHAGAVPKKVQAWIPGLPSVARDDRVGGHFFAQ